MDADFSISAWKFTTNAARVVSIGPVVHFTRLFFRQGPSTRTSSAHAAYSSKDLQQHVLNRSAAEDGPVSTCCKIHRIYGQTILLINCE